MAQTKVKLISDGVIDVNHLASGHGITTDNIGEGSNLYYTDARVSTYLSTNNYATEGYVTTAVANLVDSAPTTLDTLNELAAALGDDPNFATTVTNSIATKLPLAGGTLTGNLSLQTSDDTRLSLSDTTDSSSITVRADFTNSIYSNKSLNIYTENADHISFSTNGQSSERVRIDSSGNVGIGTISPSVNFNVGHANHGLGMAYLGGSSLPSIAGLFTDSGTNGGSGYGDLHIKSRSDYGVYSILFHTAASNNVPEPRMIIDNGGDVGIGVTSPNSRLHVASPDPAIEFNLIDFRNPSYGIYAKTNSIGSRGNTLEFTATDYNLGGTVLTHDVLTLRPEGNVGIGTNDPQQMLHVNGNVQIGTDSNQYIKFHTGTNWYYYLKATNDDFFIEDAQGLRFFTAAYSGGTTSKFASILNHLYVVNNGNVGIGTASPQAKLQIVNPINQGTVPAAGTGSTQGVIISNDLNTYGMFVGSTGDGKGYIQQQRTDTATHYDLLIQPNGGKVGIGTSSPSSILHLKDNFGSGVAITFDRTENAVVDTLFYAGVSSNGTTATDIMWLGTSVSDFVIRDNGLVGVGTSLPSTRFHVYHPTTNVVSTFESGDSDVWIDLRDNAASTYGVLIGAQGGDFRVSPNNDEVFRIKSTGEVGIGTQTPAGKLNTYVSANRQITHYGNNGDLSVISDNNSQTVFYIKGNGNAPMMSVHDSTKTAFQILGNRNVRIHHGYGDFYQNLGTVAATTGNYYHIRLRTPWDDTGMTMFRITGYHPYGNYAESYMGAYRYPNSTYRYTPYGQINHNQGTLAAAHSQYNTNASPGYLVLVVYWPSSYTGVMVEHIGAGDQYGARMDTELEIIDFVKTTDDTTPQW